MELVTGSWGLIPFDFVAGDWRFEDAFNSILQSEAESSSHLTCRVAFADIFAMSK
jgi:hypothetical protein